MQKVILAVCLILGLGAAANAQQTLFETYLQMKPYADAHHKKTQERAEAKQKAEKQFNESKEESDLKYKGWTSAEYKDKDSVNSVLLTLASTTEAKAVFGNPNEKTSWAGITAINGIIKEVLNINDYSKLIIYVNKQNKETVVVNAVDTKEIRVPNLDLLETVERIKKEAEERKREYWRLRYSGYGPILENK
jgi:hypothetical protein